jgi:hypothetical protein
VTISRPARPRWPGILAAGIAGILIGVGVGLALGGGDDESDPLAGVRDARGSLQRSASVLDIVTVEYAEGVQDGRVVSAPEYQGARRAIARSRELYADARPVLVYVDAELATRIDDAFQRLAQEASARVPEEELAADARALARSLGNAIAPGG